MQGNFSFYDFDIHEGEYKELAWRSIGRFDDTVKVLRFNNHLIHTNDIDSFFKCFRCPSFDNFFNKFDNFNKHLIEYKHWVKHIHPKIMYELRKTLFKKLGRIQSSSFWRKQNFSKSNKFLKTCTKFSLLIIESYWWTHLLTLMSQRTLHLISSCRLRKVGWIWEKNFKFQDIDVVVNERMKKNVGQFNEGDKNSEASEEADMSTTQFWEFRKICSLIWNNILRVMWLLCLFLDFLFVDMNWIWSSPT